MVVWNQSYGDFNSHFPKHLSENFQVLRKSMWTIQMLYRKNYHEFTIQLVENLQKDKLGGYGRLHQKSDT